LIKQFFLESGSVYDYRNIPCNLRDVGEQCGENRVDRLMPVVGLHAQVGYCCPRHRIGPSSVLVPNRLQQKFEVTNPNEGWATDIAPIRKHEGWLYLAVIVDNIEILELQQAAWL